jgi:hypothetical protein
LFGDFAPTVLTDWDDFAFDLDVEFDVFAVTGVFPWVFTMFNVMFQGLFLKNSYGANFAFKDPV